MRRVIVRYRVRSAAAAAENERLVRDVYAELERLAPDGFRYVTLVGDDGLSFTHVAFEAGEASPLPGLAAFARFRAGLGERCAEPPVATEQRVVGSYGIGAG